MSGNIDCANSSVLCSHVYFRAEELLPLRDVQRDVRRRVGGADAGGALRPDALRALRGPRLRLRGLQRVRAHRGRHKVRVRVRVCVCVCVNGVCVDREHGDVCVCVCVCPREWANECLCVPRHDVESVLCLTSSTGVKSMQDLTCWRAHACACALRT